MTNQITIKLNEKRFKPLLDKLIECGCDTSKNYSECVGKCLFFLNQFMLEKQKELNDKTRFEFLLEKSDISKDEFIIKLLADYNKFIKNQNRRCLSKLLHPIFILNLQRIENPSQFFPSKHFLSFIELLINPIKMIKLSIANNDGSN